MGISESKGRLRLRNELFVLSTGWFVAILILQQIFDLATTLYITSYPGGYEANPILAPLWNAPGGILWLAILKAAICALIATGVPHLAKHYPEYMLGPKIVCFVYWLVVLWNGFLVVSTLV